MAGRFRFRLEIVLQLRERAEQAQQQVLAEAQRTAGDVRRRYEAFADAIGESRETERGMRQSRVLDLETVRQLQWHQGWLKSELRSAEARLRAQSAKVEEERAKLAEAAMQRRVIEKLREKRLEQHRLILKREEQKRMDEIALNMLAKGLECQDESDLDAQFQEIRG